MIVKRAAEWGVDTARLGMIGFSAGAGLTMHSTLNSKVMQLDFIGPIYGGMGPVEVPKNAPPMFNVIASDDFLFRGQFGVIESWFKAGRPVEFHLYQNGGHGFGLHSGAIAARSMGGAITVASAGIGQGATFTLELPIASTASVT